VLNIRESQMRAFREARLRAYTDKIRVRVGSTLQQERIDARAPLDQVVDRALDMATEIDIFGEDSIVRLAVFLARYGVTVGEGPDDDWALQILRDPRRAEADRLAAVEAAARERETDRSC